MIDLGKHNILGIQINAIDYEATVEKVITAAKNNQSLTITALAVHGVMSGALDRNHRYRLNHFDLIVPDGQPVRWALNLLYKVHLSDRVYGPTLTLKICERAARDNLPIYLYGSKSEVIDKLSKELIKMYPNIQIVGIQPSRFHQVSLEEKYETISNIKSSGAKIVLVGLGCPRQEVWIFENCNQLSIPTIAVGAAFDFHAKTISQAPEIMQRLGLEWFFRLVKEPRRLWKRYIFLNPLFLLMLFMQATCIRKYNPESGIQPENELRYG